MKLRKRTERQGGSGAKHRESTPGKEKITKQSTAGSRSSKIQKDEIRPRYNLRSRIENPQPSAKLQDNENNRFNRSRETHLEDYPDLDFHHTFGSSMTRKNPVSKDNHPDIARYWDLLSRSPSELQHHIYQINDGYRTAFRDFFTAEPLSLHGHVSDASNAALLTSIISHLVSHASSSSSSSSKKNLFFDHTAKSNPRLAITEKAYGAGYGCLAYHAVINSNRPLANGPRPILIKLHPPTTIAAQVRKAKNAGCIALITEMVRAGDGKVITELAWKYLVESCEREGIVLVVDEALTAVRCGAPFAYQLQEYKRYGYPDLVLFGKAIRTNGVAVEWRGGNMRKLGIGGREGRMFVLLDWQERFTEMASPGDLLMSWGTLVLAMREGWPGRAVSVGRAVREVLEEEEGVGGWDVGGLNALVYLRKGVFGKLRFPVMGAKAGGFVRLFPALDEVMGEKGELRRKVFGEGSLEHRREVGEYLKRRGVKMGFCGRCGNAVAEEVESCDVCVVRVCEECEPGVHVCPIGEGGG
ncbi:MAG: hypothetical protein L6R40_003473 [Gallowayella cf. fulva]|nr:MAG: hypothetical protein L6R40_003473 [Xanthomendoza cf. fulva]